jgi:hypothetical protein
MNWWWFRQMRVNSADIEEIAPDRFIVRDMRAKPILRGEGELQGSIFELRTWRREGLIARLRTAGLHVSALEDQVHALPGLPPAPAIGLTGWRKLATASERFSRFDAIQLRWVAIAPTERAGEPGIEMPVGHPLRRRKSRGASEYYLALAERHGGLGLRLIDENKAILTGYAIIAERRPVVAYAERRNGDLYIPMIELPLQHRTLMERIAAADGEDWRVAERARAVYGSLGVEVGTR